MISEIKSYRTKLEHKRGEQKRLQVLKNETEEELASSKKSLRYHQKAREVIRQVGLKTQQQLSYNVGEITSMALESVLQDPYQLKLDFVERRNKTECDIIFTRRGIDIDPFSGGGGAIDVASFSLRIASWVMSSSKSRNTLILDEPFKHLKGEETNRRMLLMLKQISEKLGIQIIMVSDERVSREATIESTDRLFETTIKEGVTEVKQC